MRNAVEAERYLLNRAPVKLTLEQHLGKLTARQKGSFLKQIGRTVAPGWGDSKLNAEIQTWLREASDSALAALAAKETPTIRLIWDGDTEPSAAPAAPEEPLTMPGKGSGGGRFERLGPAAIAVVANPRKRFDEGKLAELAQSIREHGILEPLVVNEVDGQYELIAGERRLRASRLAGLPFVPCTVLQVSRAEAAELRLLENLQREDLSPLEEAEAFAELLHQHGFTQEKLARRMGKSQAWVSERMGLRGLPQVLQDAVDSRELAARAALAIRPYLLRDGTVPEAAGEVAKLMAEHRPPAAEAVRFVREHMGYRGKTLHEADAWERNQTHLPRGRVFSLDQEVAGAKETVSARCTGCPMRHTAESARGPLELCLQPSCWERKQQAAWEPVMAERLKTEREKKTEQEERLQVQVQRATAKALEGAPEAPAPVDELAAAAIKLHELGKIFATAYLSNKRTQLTQEMGQIATGLGFDSLQEMERGLAAGGAGGDGRMHAGMFQPAEVARRLASLLVRKAAGEDITQPVVMATPNQQQARIVTAPPLPGADPAQAQALAQIGRQQWTEDQSLRASSEILYQREMYLPLADLIAHWDARSQLGASSMPLQVGGMQIHIPEQQVWITGQEQGDKPCLRLDGSNIHVASNSGRIIQPGPAPMVYYRVQVGGSAYKWLYQQVVLPGGGRHIVVTASAAVQMRKDLLPKWQRLMNELPGMPEGDGA